MKSQFTRLKAKVYENHDAVNHLDVSASDGLSSPAEAAPSSTATPIARIATVTFAEAGEPHVRLGRIATGMSSTKIRFERPKMKFTYQIIILAAAGILAGCSRSDQANNGTERSVTAQEVKDKYKDAATATKDYVAQNKDDFVASMDNKLKELDAKISELARKSEPYRDEAKAKADKALAELREQRKAAGEQLEKAKQSSAEAWEKVKAGFASAMDDLEKAYEKAKSKFE